MREPASVLVLGKIRRIFCCRLRLFVCDFCVKNCDYHVDNAVSMSVFFSLTNSFLMRPLFVFCMPDSAQALMAAVAQQPVSIAIEADDVSWQH